MDNRSSLTKPLLFTEKEKSKMSLGNLLSFSCCFDDVLFVEVINYKLWNCLLEFVRVLWRKQSVYAGLSTLALTLPIAHLLQWELFRRAVKPTLLNAEVHFKKKRGLTAHVVIPPAKFKMQYSCSEPGKVSEYVTNSCTALWPPTIYEQHRERWSSTAEQLMERVQKETWDLKLTQRTRYITAAIYDTDEQMYGKTIGDGSTTKPKEISWVLQPYPSNCPEEEGAIHYPPPQDTTKPVLNTAEKGPRNA